jgi:predicted aspartyl protease
MAKVKITLITLIAFSLGFGASEYLRLVKQRQVIEFPSGPLVGEDNQGNGALRSNTDISTIEPHALNREAFDAPNKVELSKAEAGDVFSWTRINQLIASSNYDEAIRLLQRYLVDNANSAQAWYLLAHIYKNQAQPTAALNAWFRYLKLEMDRQKIDQALQEMKNYAVQLNEKTSLFNDDYSWLIAQLDNMLSYNANDGELHLIMASLSLKLNDTYQAQYHALMAANDPKAQKRAEDILAKINGENIPDEVTIPLIRFGSQYLVSVNIEGYPARLLLDTGASLTGLSNTYTLQYPSLLKAIKPIRLNTASGAQNSFLFTVNNISFGNIVFNQHILAQLPMDNTQGFDGLLGVDILGQFDFVIDQDAAVLKLKTRKK